MRIAPLRCALVGVALLVGSSGCNVFEGFNDRQPSGDAAVLLIDGQRALERGHAEEASRLLGRAVALTKVNSYEGRVARLKLASALLLQQRLSLLLVQDVADDVVRRLDEPLPAPRPDSLGPVCTGNGSTRLALAPLPLEAVTGATQIRSARPVLDSVRTLMQQTFSGALFPASVEQIQRALGSLVAQGADDLLLAEVLANATIVQVAIGYDDLRAAGAKNQVTWIRERDLALATNVPGACASSRAFLLTLRVDASLPLELIRSSAEMARIRGGYFAAGSGAQMFAMDLAAFRDRLEAGLLTAF